MNHSSQIAKCAEEIVASDPMPYQGAHEIISDILRRHFKEPRDNQVYDPMLSGIRAGDRVALFDGGPGQTPSLRYLVTVSKVTKQQIHTPSQRFDRITGTALTSFCKQRKISANPIHLEPLLKQEEEDKAQRAAAEKLILERDGRVTYQLAAQIVDEVMPENTIADLELLGEQMLREILTIIKTKRAEELSNE